MNSVVDFERLKQEACIVVFCTFVKDNSRDSPIAGAPRT